MSDIAPGLRSGFRPPIYGPGQNAALMQDPMSAMMVMMGMPMVQQVLGPDKFLPQLTPNQALMDQFAGSRYQRDTYAALQNANERGNAAVAGRLLGLRSLVTDAPTTPLIREQASNFAGMINSPIVKTMLGNLVGPDRLEAALFGRRGDPAALAQSATRVGYFRKDALGGEGRMSGAQMASFAENIYENLYGKGADVDAMHGFMAGQSGQLLQDMMQRGQLARSIGALNPADRVRAISAGQRDDATMTRLAEQFGRQELEKDDRYVKGTEEEKRKMLAARMPEFETRMKNTFAEIDRFKAADPRAKSAQDIEKLEGYGVAARNVDTQKISKALKDRLGAVDAVREIFGDQGVDAPFNALVEALDSLSGGAVDRVDSNKVEKTLREMRSGIRDAGLSLESVGRIGARGEALAQMYGISDQGKMSMNNQTIRMLAAMQDTGAYSKKIFGQMTPIEAEQEIQGRLARFRKSEAAVTLATINRAYEANPDLYKGTELEAAYQAAKDPNGDGTYKFDGQSRNVFDDVVNYRRAAGQRLFQRSGSSAEIFDSFSYDPATEENMSDEAAFALQRRNVIKDIAQRTLQDQIRGRLVNKPGTDALRPANKTEAQFEQDRNTLGNRMSFELARVIVNETGQMTKEERGAHLEKRHKEIMQEQLVAMGYQKAEAARLASSLSETAFGDSEGRRRETFDAIASRANYFLQKQTGRGLAAQGQLGPEAEKAAAANRAKYTAAAEKEAALSKGRETSFLQRAGEVLEKRVDNPNYSRGQQIDDLFNVMTTAGFEMSPEQRKDFDARANAVLDRAAKDPTYTKDRQLEQLYHDAWTVAGPGETERADAVSKMTPEQRKKHEMIMRGTKGKGRAVPAGASATEQAAAKDQLHSVGATESAAPTAAEQANLMIGAAGVGAATGAALGAPLGPIGSLVGAGIGGVAGLVGGGMYLNTTAPTAGQAAAAAQQADQAASGTNEITINGTLALRGMNEAMLAAVGNRPMDTPGGGAPVYG